MLAKTEAVPGQVCNRVGKIHIFWSEIGQWFQDIGCTAYFHTNFRGVFPGAGWGRPTSPTHGTNEGTTSPLLFWYEGPGL